MYNATERRGSQPRFGDGDNFMATPEILHDPVCRAQNAELHASAPEERMQNIFRGLKVTNSRCLFQRLLVARTQMVHQWIDATTVKRL